jgi:hypothetical protein
VLSEVVRWSRRQPPIHLFLLWSAARPQQGRILADIDAHFQVLDLIELTWTRGETFALNLSRMYGDDLPPGSAKELHCGDGPFLVAVVEDLHPRYRLRRTNRGPRILNSGVFDARRRYRAWTDGGYKVHASDSVSETQRNLALLLGEDTEHFRGRRARIPDPARRVARDLVGTDGWESMEQLRLALAAHGARLRRSAGDGGTFAVVGPDVWWIELVVGGSKVASGVRDIVVSGQPVRLIMRETLSGYVGAGRHRLWLAWRRLRTRLA